MQRSALALAFVLALAGAGFGEDGVADAVAALADPGRRDAAIETLASARTKDAGTIVAAASRLADDEAVWTALGTALLRWDGSSAADALSRSRTEWPAASRTRLDRLVNVLRKGKPLGELPGLAQSSKEVSDDVRATLARYDASRSYEEPNPDAERLAALGRHALPALFAGLRERTGADRDLATRVAADALATMLTEDDVPLVGRLLAEGCTSAARCLRRLKTPAARDVLVATVERDVLDSEVTDALRVQGEDRRADLAVMGWIERNPRSEECGEAAKLLAQRRCVDAVPAIAAALDSNDNGRGEAATAAALAALGDVRGIQALLDRFSSPDPGWERTHAGEALNDVTGHRIFVVTEGGPGRRSTANFDEADAAFRVWWKKKGGTLRFDATSGRWLADGEEPFVLPESPPAVAAKVREILSTFDGQQSFSAMGGGVPQLVALGRNAVPELLRELAAKRERSEFARSHACVWALKDLATEEDIPLLARILLDGRDEAASCFERLHCNASRDALLDAMGEGIGGYTVSKALLPYASDPRTQEAAIGWIEQFGASDAAVGEVAKLLEEHGGEPALEALRAALERRVPDHALAPVLTAMAKLGDRDAVERLVDLTETDARGATDAAHALNGISGIRAFNSNRYGAVGRSGNLDQASAVFRKWWNESKDSLTFDEKRRRWSAGGAGPAADVGKSPPAVAQRVDAILRRVAESGRFSPMDGEVESLVALGRDAIPALAEALRAFETRGPGRTGRSDGGRTAAEALRRLRTDADVELLVRLLLEGHSAVAPSLAGCHDPRVKEGVLAVVARGASDHEILELLEGFPPDAAVWSAVEKGLEIAGDGAGAGLASYCEENATPESAPMLRKLLARDGLDSTVRARCAAALAWAGGSDGIEALIGVLSSPAPQRPWEEDARDVAALHLNSLAGLRVFVPPDTASDGTSHADAAARFGKWWDAGGSGLQFDPARRVWASGSPKPLADATLAPELAAKFGAALDAARSARSMVISSSAGFLDTNARALADLGHAIVPALAAELRRSRPWESSHRDRNGRNAVEQALCALAEDGDRALMTELLGEGRLGAAPWFGMHRSAESRVALLTVVRRGFLDRNVLAALAPDQRDASVLQVVAGWAEKYGASETDLIDHGATLDEFLGATTRPGGEPVAAGVLERPIPAHTRLRIAARLARNGHKPAVAALVELLEKGEGMTGEDVALCATALNEIADAKIVEIAGAAPGFPSPSSFPTSPGGKHLRSFRTNNAGTVADRSAAAKAVRAWWDAASASLTFDAAAGRWTQSK